MEFAYRIFGLNVHADRAIPGLEPARRPRNAADVEIHLGLAPYIKEKSSVLPETLIFVSSILLESGQPTLRVWKVLGGAFLRLEYFDGVQFWLEPGGKTIWGIWSDESSIEDAATYLLGPVFGLVLRLRGVTCLHASAVAFGDCAVAFTGCEGAGKSTTAAALAHHGGHSVISDDIVGLVECDDVFLVLPAYPHLCLWPDSVNMLYGSDKPLPSFSPNWDKRRLSLTGNRLHFEERQLSLGAIFVLGERSVDAAAPFLEKLPLQESLVCLIANSYASSLLDNNMRAREFELLGRMLVGVPVWRLRAHEDASRIDRLTELISNVCNQLPGPCLDVPRPPKV